MNIKTFVFFLILYFILLPGLLSASENKNYDGSKTFLKEQKDKHKKKKKKNNKTKNLSESEKFKEADYFAKAVVKRVIGEPLESMKLLDKALAIDPDDAAALYEKSRLLSALSRNEEAYLLALKAKNIEPENKWYKMNFANLAMRMEKYDEYVKTYEELAEQYPDNFEFLSELAYAYFYTGDYKNAVKQYHKVEEQVGINEAIVNQIVNLYTRLEKYDKAVEEYEKLIKSDPENTHYYAVLAEYCAKNNMPEKALWAYQQIEKINPGDPYIHISMADFYRKQGDTLQSFEELKKGMANKNLDLQTKIQLLVSYYPGKLTEEQQKQALELSRILMKTHPDDPASKSLYGSLLYQNQDYKEAKTVFKEILASDSLSNYSLWEQLLFCEYNLKEYNELAKDAETVTSLFPNQPLPYLLEGMGYYLLKDYKKAEKILETGKDFAITNPQLLSEFYSYLGEIYYQQKNYDACFKAYDKALEINPDNSLVLNNYAYYLSLRKQNLDKAAEMAKRAVNLDQKNSNNLDTYAWVLFQQGKYKEAEKWQKMALDNGGYDSGVVLEHYGDILYKLGDVDNAVKYWEMALAHKEHSKVLEKKIKERKYYEE